MNENKFGALDGFDAVSTDELMQVEGGLFGISWKDVKDTVKAVVSAVVEVITRK